MNKFYVTTPIYYVNDNPHIGHAYTTILADVLSRYHRVAGDDVFFLTGVDEHGQKVQAAAEKMGVLPQEHANAMAPRFQELWQKLGISNDDFIRTTETRHKQVVQDCLQRLFDKGDIYMGEYEGWYSVAEERFITEEEKASGAFRDVKSIKEQNYFFKMGQYQKQLVDYIASHPGFIRPEHRKNEVLGFLKQPLGDLCISRPKTRLAWGIEIPFAREYVTYVWFDALVNYISAVGFGNDQKKFAQWWPADVQLIGKDILTTHSVYWTTMLFALGVPLPKTIFAHGWWLINQTKMSKSLGNVVNPLDLVTEYGVDAVRYYLMKEMILGNDANFTLESFIKCFNSDLANDFGNLLNRVSGLITKLFDGRVPEGDEVPEGDDKAIEEKAASLPSLVSGLINDLKVQEAVEEAIGLVRMVNAYVEKQAPWKAAKTDLARAGTILYTATEALRIAAILLSPVMPSKCARVLEILSAVGSKPAWGGLKAGVQIPSHEALFPRLEAEKK